MDSSDARKLSRSTQDAIRRKAVKVFLELLARMVKQREGRNVFLIVDRHSVHKAKKVAEWLVEHEDKIRLFFLPSYSPELHFDNLRIRISREVSFVMARLRTSLN